MRPVLTLVLLLAAAVPELVSAQRAPQPLSPPQQTVSVTPTAGQTGPRAPNSSSWTAVFTVTNTGTVSASYEVFSWSSTNVIITGQSPSDSVRNLAPSGTANVTVTYSTGSAGLGSLSLQADNNLTMAQGNYSVPVGNDVVTVTPKGANTTGDPYLPYSQIYTVTSQAYPDSLTLTPSCSGSGVNATSCSVSPGSLILAPFASGNATISYWTRGNGTTGTVALRAKNTSNGALRDTGYVTVTVGTTGGTQQAPQVAIADVNAGTTVEPSLCLTVALGSGAASACGDLRLVHALPTLRTYNQRRTPVLLYSSAVAEPAGQVAALVTLPTGAASPDSIEAKLHVNGAVRDSGRWAGNEWEPGRPRRIVLRYAAPTASTALYSDTLEVTSIYGSSRLSTTAPGQFLIVNRRQSAFGAGWWLAGLEWLDPATKLWIGGDGSAHVYQPVNATTWVAPAVDFPDTVVKLNGQFIRRGPGKLEVHFDTLTGRHVATINRLGHTTAFAYDGQGRLSTITVPAPSGSARQTYSFQYATGTVTVTDSLSGSDALKHQVLLYLASSGRVDSIADAGGHVRFGYADTTRRVTTRTDRRGTVRTFTYDAGGRVTKDSLSPGTGLTPIVLTLRPIESQGLHGSGTPSSVDAVLAYSLVDGPRTDVGDSTMFFLDRYGEPKTIRDAMGGVTYLGRQNATYPVLVTSVTYPDSGVMNATYDARGHVATVSDTRAIVRGSAATVTTSYTWDPVFDAVTAVRKPEYGRDSILYDAATGNRLWEQNPAGYRVQYTYYATTYNRAPGLLASVRAPGASAVDTVIYDAALGNVDSVRTPLGFWTKSYADNRGRDTLVVSPMDSSQTRMIGHRTTYDAMDRATWTGTDGPASPYFNWWTGRSDSMWANTLGRTNTYDAEGNLTEVLARTEAGPDSTLVTTHEWRYYDLAGRDTSHTLASATTRTQYDPAGNVTQVTTGRGTLTMTYDPMNRLATRVVPAYTYASESCTLLQPACRWAFPLYPNDGGTGLLIPADTARFTYDLLSRMVTANNRDAQIRRTYAKNGWLLTDSLRIRNYGSLTFSQYVYGLAMRYDSLGRRVVLKLPSGLGNGSADSIRYIYNPQTGALQELRDLRRDRFVYSDDSLGRQVSLAIYDSTDTNTIKVRETRTYDADDRLRTRVTTGAADSVLQRDSLWYDADGRVLRASYSGLAVGTGSWTLAYGGVGGLIYSEKYQTAPTFDHRGEEWRRDGLGNPVWHATYGAVGAPPPQYMSYDYIHGGQLTRQGTLTCPPSSNYCPDSTYFAYDADKNLHYRNQAQMQAPSSSVVTSYVTERHYYGADDRLRVVERAALGQFDSQSPSAYLSAPALGVWEEYRYDALGRRILVRARRDDLSNQQYGYSTLDRVIWDGNQVVFELRAPGGSTDNLDSYAWGSPNPPYGKVGYLHGRDLDEPLALLDKRVPLRTWRGADVSSVWTTGQAADCSRMLPCDGVNVINWPENRWSDDMAPWGSSGSPTNYLYVGSLLMGSQDGTGMMYRRNRYYDPQSAKFTQIDPIGLAGGVNAYGFGGGDPITFQDPFGLCPPPPGKVDPLCAAANFFAGFGDALTFGLTAKLRGEADAQVDRSSGLYLAGQATGVAAGTVLTSGLASGAEGAAAGAASVSETVGAGEQIGTQFIGRAISGFTKHGIDQVISRGVSPQALLDAARTGATRGPIVDQLGRESLRITGKAAEFAINLLGQVITAWPK